MSLFCDCSQDGYCPRYKRNMSGHLREICRGENVTDTDKAMLYRLQWLAQAHGNDPDYLGAMRAKLAAAHQTMENRALPASWRRALATVKRCKHLRHEIGETTQCSRCKQGVRLKVFACVLHGRCTLANHGDGVEHSCGDCPDHVPDEAALYVDCTFGAIGDHLMALSIAEGLRWQNPNRPIAVVPATHQVSWARMFWPLVRLPGTAQEPKVVCRDHRGAGCGKFYWEHWQRLFKVKALIPRFLGGDLPDAQALQGHVIIAPFAAAAVRNWALENWLDLERELGKRGIPCAIFHPHNDERLTRFAGKKYIGLAPMFVASAVRNALAVAGNDSGMSHLAGILQRPGVAVCTPITDFRDIWPTVRSMGGRRERMPAPVAVADALMAQAANVRPRPSCTVAVVTAWDDAYESVAERTWPALANYCHALGYVPVRGAVDGSRPASWSKIPAILAAMDAGAEVVLWIDADAKIVHRTDVLELLGTADAAYALDWRGKFNAGVLILRDCAWVREALRSAWNAGVDDPNGDCWEQWHVERELQKYPDRCREVPRAELNAYPGEECRFIRHATGIGISLAQRLKILAQPA